jgi:hypothetical protein
VLRFIVSDRISILHLCPRPKTFTQTNHDGLHERLIGVVLEKLGEMVNINVAGDFEKLRVVADCFIGRNVFELGERRTREGVRENGVPSSRTDSVDRSSPN